MDLEKLTDRARGFLQAAQTIAVREHHQRITPAHYLKALLDDEQGMAVGLINAAGGDGMAARRAVDELVAKQPSVTGSGATSAPGIDGDLLRVLDRAQEIAGKAGDSYVTVERILLAFAMAKGTPEGEALAGRAIQRLLEDRVGLGEAPLERRAHAARLPRSRPAGASGSATRWRRGRARRCGCALRPAR